MPVLPATTLPQRIQKLLEERQQHADAISHIDATLAAIGAALKGPSAPSPAGNAPVPKTRKRRRGRGHFAMSAEASILAFVKGHKNPMSAEIHKHLKHEGRSSSASNALGKLVREKKLKRTPMAGQRGSRYSLA
jgi:ferric-dicitrate binding protein FerR (iron transport regulator)